MRLLNQQKRGGFCYQWAGTEPRVKVSLNHKNITPFSPIMGYSWIFPNTVSIPMTFGHLWTSLAIDIARLWAGQTRVTLGWWIPCWGCWGCSPIFSKFQDHSIKFHQIPSFSTNYPLVICYIAIENDHLQWVFPLNMVIFHSFLYVYQAGYPQKITILGEIHIDLGFFPRARQKLSRNRLGRPDPRRSSVGRRCPIQCHCMGRSGRGAALWGDDDMTKKHIF